MVLLLALAGCAPGSINYPQGSSPLYTAYFQELPSDGDATETLVLLLNSTLDCDLTPEDADPVTREQAMAELYIALTREDARVVFLSLKRYVSATDPVGWYPIHDEPSVDYLLDGASPFAARAAYVGINEARVVEDDGLYRAYEPVDVEGGWMDEPSEVRITRSGDTLVGSFEFAEVDVSGRFRASPCDELEFPASLAGAVLAQYGATPQDDTEQD
ncbi:MAG: hypothetical protein H6739_20590 [Alphaproteobacteria bacterium]|nr:hypothetical protein [Alphaproteobacteria bacterium]